MTMAPQRGRCEASFQAWDFTGTWTRLYGQGIMSEAADDTRLQQDGCRRTCQHGMFRMIEPLRWAYT